MDKKQAPPSSRFKPVSIMLVAAIIAVLIAWRVERSNFEHDTEDSFGVLSLIADEVQPSNLDSIVGIWKANFSNCLYELEIEPDGKFKWTRSRFITEIYAGTYRLRDDGLFLFTITQAGDSDWDTEVDFESDSSFAKKLRAKFVGREHGLRIATDESGAMLIFEEQTNFKKHTGLPWDLEWDVPWRKQE